MPPAKRWLGVFAANTVTLVALAVAAEALARKLCHEDFEALFPRREPVFRSDSLMEPHPERGSALARGYVDDSYRINSAGFRGPEFPEDVRQRFLVVALGDSTTFGWGVAEGRDYPRRLQEILGERGPAGTYVANGGVPGYTSSQTRLYLREVLDGELAPDLVLVSVLWNDIWFSTVADWHPHILVQRPPSAWRRWLLESSGLYRCLQISRVAEQGIVDVFNEPAFEAYLDNLDRMFRLARRRGVPLVMVDPPFDGAHMPAQGLNRFHVTYTRDFFIELAHKHLAASAELAERHGVPIAHHRLSIEDLDQYDYFQDALHPNAEGNEIIAADVARFLIDRGLVPASVRE